MEQLTFRDFLEVLIGRIKEFVELPGPWPYGVFGRDDTEGLIQYGSTSVACFIEGTSAQINVRIPGRPVRTFHSTLSREEAAAIGDQVGKLLAAQKGLEK
jgi:hypothetical protein